MITSNMFITRLVNIITFTDAAGVHEYEDQEIDIEVEISGNFCRADPDVGIMSDYFEDVCAINIEDGEPIELTDKELDKAQEILSDEKYYGE